jgi:prepilin-type N-terminal cleavage/methylation domain-containing protein
MSTITSSDFSKNMRRVTRRRLQTKRFYTGFTLVELLVVIAIIGVLSVAAYVIVDPIELFKKGRDSLRLNDLLGVHTVIGIAVQDATQSGAQLLCNGAAAPCSGASNATSSAIRKVDGTGWVKVNLTGKSTALTSFASRSNKFRLKYLYLYHQFCR